MKTSTSLVCFLVISCLIVMNSAQEEYYDEAKAPPEGGRRNLPLLGRDFSRIIQDVGRLGAHVISGVGQVGQQLLPGNLLG